MNNCKCFKCTNFCMTNKFSLFPTMYCSIYGYLQLNRDYKEVMYFSNRCKDFQIK